METTGITETKKASKLEQFSRQEIIQKNIILESELERVVRENYQLRKQNITDEQLQFILQEQLVSLKDKMYGPG